MDIVQFLSLYLQPRTGKKLGDVIVGVLPRSRTTE